MSLSREEVAALMDEVESNLNSLNDAKKRSVTRSKKSFSKWVKKKVSQAAEALGYVISLPVRIVKYIVRGIWKGLFGSDDDEDDN